MKLYILFRQKILFRRKTLFLSIIGVLGFLALTSTVIAGEVVNSNNGRYYVSAPQTTGPIPVLVYLHGQGGDHNQGQSMFENYTNQAKIILVSPEGGSPQKSWMMGSGPSVRKRVEEVLSKYENADKNNIFLVGYSAGGCVGYSFGTADSSFYKAMALVNASYQPGLISLQGQLPVYLIECEGDPNKPGAEMAKRDLESAGFTVKYDVIPASQGGSSHGYPTQTASPMIVRWIKDSVDSSSNNTSNADDNSSGSDGASNTDGTSDSNDTSDSDSNDSESNNTDTNSGGSPINSSGYDDTPTANDGSSTSDNENNDDMNNEGENKPEDKPEDQNTSSSVNDSGTEGDKPEELVEAPVINSFGIPVGGLTDSEIDSLVKEWLANVYKPSQSPPNSEGSWTINDWGIWTCGNITHSGKIDGYGSITDFWLKTSPDCFSFAENRGSELHVPAPSTSTENVPGGSEKEDQDSSPSTDKPDKANTNQDSADNSEDNDSNTETSANTGPDVNDSSENNNDSQPTINVTENDNGSSSENVPDLTAPEPSSDNNPENVNGRAVNLYRPKGLKESGNSEFGLVVALSGVAGNSDYLKMKLSAGCDSNQCVFAGINAKNASGSQFGYRWENDSSENVEFIKDVVKTIEETYGVSSKRTYLVGFSNGAHFAGSKGGSLDEIFEGFIMCEGGAIIPTSDKQILISGGGQTSFNSDKSGSKWLALCNNMGHFFPGQGIAQDPGVDKDSAGNTINGTTMIKWLEE